MVLILIIAVWFRVFADKSLSTVVKFELKGTFKMKIKNILVTMERTKEHHSRLGLNSRMNGDQIKRKHRSKHVPQTINHLPFEFLLLLCFVIYFIYFFLMNANL